MKKITVEELRMIMFEIESQEMTIRELRTKLHEEENQEMVITDRLLWKY